MELDYTSQEFPIASRNAIAKGEPFTLDVRGVAWQQLRPHVVDGQVPCWAQLSATPELRAFAIMMALAATQGVEVRVVPAGDRAKVLVGSTH